MATSDITLRPSSPASLVQIRMDSKTFPRLESLAPEDALTQLQGVIIIAAQFRGESMEPEDLTATASLLYASLMSEDRWGARFISMEEIRRAVIKAILGEDKIYRLSVETLYKAILNYCKTDGAEAARKARQLNAKKIPDSVHNMVDGYAGRMLKNIKTK